jgi:hypothetical protein
MEHHMPISGDQSSERAGGVAPVGGRKPYVVPRLAAHGNLDDIFSDVFCGEGPSGSARGIAVVLAYGRTG